MKNIIMFTGLVALFACCKKSGKPIISDSSKTDLTFTKYTIGEGKQYSDNIKPLVTSYTELKFTVKFDSTAIYTTLLPENQGDINKLFGFSDNNSTHHRYSARFGWCWNKNALRLFGYVYNNKKRSFKELGTITIGSENSCSIKVMPTNYIFTLNGVSYSLPRTSKTETALGYKLYPYFGGNESAPHNIYIWIKEE